MELGILNSAGHSTQNPLAVGDVTKSPSRTDYEDTDLLARLGKKQVLERRFGFSSLFGFSCTILITWETVLALFSQAFINGGPAGLVYGFIIAWVSALSVYVVISEMASIAPIAGGQYFWVWIFSPDSSKRFLSYITGVAECFLGWLTTIAWIASLAGGSVYCGSIVRGIIILNSSSYVPEPYHAVLLSWLVILVCIFINTVVSSWLPKIEGFFLIFHILGFFAVLITLVYMAPHGTADSVFRVSLNEGNWPTQGLSYCVGFLGNVATFVGADAAVHMAEEIENAALNVPRAIFITMILNGALGFAMTLAVLFCLGDAQEILDSPTGFPFIQIIYNATRSFVGTTVLSALVVSLVWSGVIGFTATASRMIWSFARDKSLPFHQTLQKVDRRSHVPFIAVGVVATIPAIVILIYLGSQTVFNVLISMSVSGFYGSYFIPSAMLLWRRWTKQIAEPSDPHPKHTRLMPTRGSNIDNANDKALELRLVWGPWYVPGILGTINNIYACAYMIFVMFWSFWPPATPVTPSTMNYSVLVTGTVIIFSIVYYYVYGKKQYIGPLVETEVLGVRRG